MALATRLRSTRDSSTGSVVTVRSVTRTRRSKTLGSGQGHELALQDQEDLGQRGRGHARVDGARIQARDLEQLLDQLGQGLDARRKVAHQRHQRTLGALAQQRAIDADRLQGLAQVVRGGSEELRLGARGRLGRAARIVGRGLLGEQLAHQDLVLDVALDRIGDRAAEIAPEKQREPEHRQ
jgi:hypothetical protein